MDENEIKSPLDLASDVPPTHPLLDGK